MRRVAVLAVGSFAIGTDTFVVAGVLPRLMSDLQISLAQAGQLVTVFAVAFAVCAPVLGAALGRVPRRPLLITALLLFAAANVLSAVAATFAVLLAARVIAGVAAAAYTPAAAATAAGLVPAEVRGRALALVLGGVTAATVLGVPAGTWIGLALDWRATFAMVAVLAVVSAAALTVMLPALPAPPAVPLATRLAVLADRAVLPVIATTVLIFVGGFSVYTYLAAALQRSPGFGAAGVSAALLAFGVAGVAGNWLGGRLTDRFGALPVLVGGLLGMTVSLLALPVLARTAAGAMAAVVAWGVTAWITTVPQQHRLVGAAPQAPAVAIGLNSAAVFLGIGVAGAVGAAALSAVPVTRLGHVGGVIVLAGTVIAVVQLAASRRRAAAPIAVPA